MSNQREPTKLPQDRPLRHALKRFEHRMVWVLGFFNVVLASGTLGYRYIEGWSWLDCLYMAAITATAVGYSEVHALTSAGQIFTMFLLGFSIVGLGLLWAMITALFVELDLGDAYRRRRMQKRIDAVSDHYVICGSGRMGRVIVGEMLHDNVPVVVVEQSRESIDTLLARHPDVLFVEGDANQDHCLEQAGIRQARGLAACLPTDANNLFLCLSARSLNPELEIAARAIDGASVSKMKVAGANHTVLPNVTGGVRMAATLLRPSVVSFLDATTIAGDTTLRLEELALPGPSRLVGQSLAEARIPQETGMIVLALKRAQDEGPAMFNPGPETRLVAGDIMVVLGEPDQLERLRSYAGESS